MFLKAFAMTFIFVTVFRNTLAVNCDAPTRNKLGELERILFCDVEDYFNTRPVRDNTTVTKVDVVVIPVAISIIEEKGIVKMSGYINMTWQDEFKVWRPSSYDNIKSVKSEFYDIWHPKLTTSEHYSGSWHEFLDEMDSYSTRDIRIDYNGIVRMKWAAVIYGPCDSDRSAWPFDVWTCKIIVSRRQEDDGFVVVHFKNNKAIDLSSIKHDGEWLLLDMTDPAIDDFGNTQHLELRAVLKRHSSGYFATFILPGFGFYIIATLPFCLGNKITPRLIIHFLTTAVLLLLLQNALWSIGNELLKGATICKFYLHGICLCFVGIFVTFLNAKFSTETKDPPRFIQEFLRILSDIPYMGFCLSSLVNDEKPSAYDTDNECLINPLNQYNQKWIIFFNFVDKSVCLLTLLYIIVLWFFW